MSGKSPFVSLLTVVVLGLALAGPVSAQQKPVLSGAIDESSRVTIAGSKHPLALPQFDVGTVDPTTRLDRLLLVLGPSPQQESDLQAFLDSQQDKTSPNYHHWLTPDEFGQKFGPAPQDIETVKGWLAREGFTVSSVARSGRWIEFSGTSGQVEHAFDTFLRRYDVAHGHHIANATEISVPAALAPVVKGVVSLHDFFKKPMLKNYFQARANADGTYSAITPDATLSTANGPIHALTPGDYARIYDLAPLYSATPTPLNGAGITIAVVARSDVNGSDVAGFRQITGLPPAGFSNVLTLAPDPGIDLATGDGVEAALDAEWAGAVAPGANINAVVSSSTATTDGVDLSSAYIVDKNLAPVMSVSFGACEADLGPAENAFYNSLWEQAAAQGISVMVSSGDSGAAGCDLPIQQTAATRGLAVSGLSSTPFNTAVGGTQFNDVSNSSVFWSTVNSPTGVSVIGYIPEIVWNESCDPTVPSSPCANAGFVLFGAGAGASAVYPKPVWQMGFAGFSGPARDVPDVSLTAASHDGYIICFNLSCNSGLVGIVGGTSASSPSFAGMMAIVNQAAGRQGLANYILYKLANNSCSSSARTNPSAPPPAGCVFNDITSGNNSVPGLAGFTAGSGPDVVTGLGSVNAANLVSAWKGVTLQPTTTAMDSNGTTTISATHGQNVLLSVNVTGGTAPPAPGGVVALTSNIQGPLQGLELITPVASNVGTFSGALANLPGGTYTLTAHYPGDGQFAPSDSNPVSVSISAEGSVTTLRTFGISSTGQPVATTSFPYGSFMDLHADVAGSSGQGTATGSVTYQDTTAPAAVVGSAPLNLKAESEFVLLGGNNFPAPLTLGTHALMASYTGDSSFIASNSIPLTVTVTKGNPTVTFTPVNNFVATQAGSLTVFVNPTGPIVPTGTVQFFDGGVALGSPVSLAAGSSQAGIQVTFDTEGQHSMTASYSGDSTYNPSVSSAFAVNVVAPFTFSGNTSALIAAGQTATYNLNVISSNSPTTFNGTVSLACSGAPAGTTCSISPSSVTISPTADSAPVTVTVATTLAARLAPPPHFPTWPLAVTGAVGIALLGFGKRRGPKLAMLCLLAAMLGASSCGGGGGGTPVVTPRVNTHASLTVTGVSGTHTSTAALTLTITH